MGVNIMFYHFREINFKINKIKLVSYIPTAVYLDSWK